MAIGPPPRRLLYEIVIATLIYVGSVAASMLAALCLSVVPMAFVDSTGESALFLQPVFSNFIALLIGPAIFASIAANHCRRIPAYLVALMPILWLVQFAWWRREHFISRGESAVIGLCTITGLALGYWMLR